MSVTESDEELIADLIDLPEADRERYLLRICGSDSLMRQRLVGKLEQLLTSLSVVQRQEPMTMRSSQSEVAHALSAGLGLLEQPGTVVGSYILLEKIGEGGFGIVYLAEQRHPVRRQVALKLIKLGLDTREFVARFEAERQALALMEHPNIARVFDAGGTEVGRPYFVMELVRGIPITRYCDQNQQSLHGRLQLFITVCRAVQHAHQKGVIHRDLKPSNILVVLNEDVPIPKIIDFGIAKAMGAQLTDHNLFTQLHSFIGTPAYTSPEQMEVGGVDVDTRTDIYSLGVLLYELLTGRTPFHGEELARAGLDAMRKTIRETEPSRPSAYLHSMDEREQRELATCRSSEPSKLVQLIQGDLDWIVMKCLEKDRGRRYETASGLAADLERHLADEPVLARPPGRVYKFEKFVRRNRTWMIAGTVIAIAMIAGLAFAFAGFARAKIQQRAAETARGQAEDLVSFMVKDLQPELQRAGHLPLTVQVAEKAVSYFSQLPADLNTASTERNRAIALEALAYARSSAGEKKEAASLWREGLAARRRAAAGAPRDPLIAVELALTEIIDLTQDWPLVLAEAPSPGSEAMDTRLATMAAVARKIYESQPSNREVALIFARVLTYRSRYLTAHTSRPQEALATGREAESLYRDFLVQNPMDTALSTELVQLQATISWAAEQTGNSAEAIHIAEESLAFAEEEFKKSPGNIKFRENAALTAAHLSYRLGLGLLGRQRTIATIARERWRALVEIDPENFFYRNQFAWSQLYDGLFLDWEAGRIEEARTVNERSVSLLSPVAQSLADFRMLRYMTFMLAVEAAELGDQEEARGWIGRALEWHRRCLGSVPPEVAAYPSERVPFGWEWGMALESVEDWSGLERQAGAQIDAIAEVREKEHDHEIFRRERGWANCRFGEALLRQGQPKKAIPILQESIVDLKGVVTDEMRLDAADFLSEAFIATGDMRQARVLRERNFSEREIFLTARPDWYRRRRVSETAFLLACVLDPSVPGEAERRLVLLERAHGLLTTHAAETRLSVHESELLTKIETLRATDAKP